jgi:hypothetical protein
VEGYNNNNRDLQNEVIELVQGMSDGLGCDRVRLVFSRAFELLMCCGLVVASAKFKSVRTVLTRSLKGMKYSATLLRAGARQRMRVIRLRVRLHLFVTFVKANQ